MNLEARGGDFPASANLEEQSQERPQDLSKRKFLKMLGMAAGAVFFIASLFYRI